MFKKIKSILPGVLPAAIVSIFIVGFAVFAWTEPSVAPPSPNVDAPLNVGATGQSKKGNLMLNTDGTLAYGLLVPFGNVGIGTTGPGAKLDIWGSGYNQAGTRHIRLYDTNGAQGAYGELSYSYNGTAHGLTFYSNDTENSGNNLFQVVGGVNGTEKFNIDLNGNVGIGTVSPGQKLSVAGIIESTLGGFKFPDGSIQTQAALPNPADKTGYTEGLVRIDYTFRSTCGCVATNCNANPPGYCADTYVSVSCFVGNTYQYGCLSGWSPVQVAVRNGSGASGTCLPESVTYTCYKPPVASLCGNGVSDPGEFCDDGNDVDTAGICARDCSAYNQFPNPYSGNSPMHVCGTSNYNIRADSASESQWCKEQGFSGGVANDSPSQAGYIYYAYWSGSSWACGGGYPYQASYAYYLRCAK